MPNPIHELVREVGKLLVLYEWKLTTAESCTGGGVAYHLTNLAGSSAWFDRGFVTYSNTSKEEMLGVRDETLITYGAVSEQTVREMAEGALEHSQAQVSVAITGIAGPDGGTLEKPVGTVWFAWAGIHKETCTAQHMLSGDRQAIREHAIQIALSQLLSFLQRHSSR